MTDNAFAFGIGIGTRNNDDQWLEVFYPLPALAPSAEFAAAVREFNTSEPLDDGDLRHLRLGLEQAGEKEQAAMVSQLLDSERPIIAVLLEADTAPARAISSCTCYRIGWSPHTAPTSRACLAYCQM
jgi:2,3,4,5-tetrahydropyridine-2-carboxylate N-succinyltransferase